MNSGKPIYSSNAFLWNGMNRLPGTLELYTLAVFFRLNNFNESHLNLCIPLAEIEKMEEFLVFDLAKIGLRFYGANGKYDLFVLEDGSVFKKMVYAQIRKSNLVN